jgi:hypothetical protein
MKITLFVTVTLFILVSMNSVLGWCNDSYPYRKEINLTNTHGSSLTDYQVPINVTYELNMSFDFSNGTFCDDDDTTVLNFWIEKKVDNSWAYTWVKVPQLDATDKVYYYYGDVNTTSLSNPNKTFELFDDFNILNTTTWESYSSTCVNWINSGELWLDCPKSVTDKWTTINSTIKFSPNHSVIIYGIPNNMSTLSHSHTEGGFGSPQQQAIAPFTTNAIGWNTYQEGNNRTVTSKAGTNTFTNTNMQMGNPNKRYEFKWNDTSAEFWYEWNLNQTHTTNIPTVSLPIGFRTATESGGGTPTDEAFGSRIDWLFVRNYIYPEPTFLMGSEEICTPNWLVVNNITSCFNSTNLNNEVNYTDLNNCQENYTSITYPTLIYTLTNTYQDCKNISTTETIDVYNDTSSCDYSYLVESNYINCGDYYECQLGICTYSGTCGDLFCMIGEGETQNNCCVDCGCSIFQRCKENVCEEKILERTITDVGEGFGNFLDKIRDPLVTFVIGLGLLFIILFIVYAIFNGLNQNIV